MEHYYFSGSLTREMHDRMMALDDWEPIDVLVSQLDRNGVKTALDFKKDGLVKKLFVDSGAFSVHTGKAKLDLDEYISYINSLDDDIEVFAQMDTIPGTFGQPKTDEDYAESATKSWENYLYMRSKMKSPKKLTPVFHYGESFDHLRNMLEWKDENGEHIPYIGISPANDSSQKVKNRYMGEVYDVIAKSSNPNVKTHLYGMTSLDALTKYPCYSADSISHRLQSAYNKIYTRRWGTISMSDAKRTSSTKSNLSFIRTADEYTLKEFKEFLKSYNTDIDEVRNNNAVRCVICIGEIQKFLKENPYKPTNRLRSKKLFDIPTRR